MGWYLAIVVTHLVLFITYAPEPEQGALLGMALAATVTRPSKRSLTPA